MAIKSLKMPKHPKTNSIPTEINRGFTTACGKSWSQARANWGNPRSLLLILLKILVVRH